MAEEKEMALAKTVYEDMCAALDRRNWKYDRHDDDLVVTFTVTGEDLPMEFVLIVDADRQLIRVLSKLPVKVPEDKRMDLAIATCIITNKLADGSFDYDISNGDIYFRLTSSFRESKIGDKLFDYLVGVSCFTVDSYNDKLFALAKGLMSIEDFLK